MQILRNRSLFLIAVITVLVAAVTACGSSNPRPAPEGLNVASNAEGRIQYLLWDAPEYRIDGYEFEWRFQDVPFWSPQTGLRFNTPNDGQVTAFEISSGTLTRGYEADYCYRVRAKTTGAKFSEWSDEVCAYHWNYWWTQSFGLDLMPDWLSDISLIVSGGSTELSWLLTNPSPLERNRNTASVDIWRRSVGGADYEALSSLVPGEVESLAMSYVDDGVTDGYCYRLEMKASVDGSHLSDEFCP